MNEKLKQCAHVDEDGNRCRKKTALKLRLHLDGRYKYPAWVEVNLCIEHHLHFGGSFKKEMINWRTK
jgi:hypothetical protein